MTDRRPLAYIVLAQGSSETLETLFGSIYTERDLFVVHLDAKSPWQAKAFLSALSGRRANILSLPGRPCSWGSFSLVDAALRAIDVLLKSRIDWGHVLLLSEQHYPIVPSSDLPSRLEDGVSYVDAVAYTAFYPVGRRDIEHRFSRCFHEVEGVGSFFRSQRCEDLSRVYHAAQWLILSRKAAAYVSARFEGEEVRSFFAASLIPDETAFPTVLMNGAEEDRGPIRVAETTFVAWPHRTDNGGMVANRGTFEEARRAGALFVRKRPASMEHLAEFEIAGQDPSGGRPPYRAMARELWRRATGPRLDRLPADPAGELALRAVGPLDVLKTQLARFEVADHRDVRPSTTIYLSVRLPHWLAGLRVVVLSYNLVDYAVVLVAEPADASGYVSFDERRLGGFRTHKLKVRIKDLFMNDQVECPLAGAGIVRVAEIGRPREVVDAVLDAARHADGIPA